MRSNKKKDMHGTVGNVSDGRTNIEQTQIDYSRFTHIARNNFGAETSEHAAGR